MSPGTRPIHFTHRATIITKRLATKGLLFSGGLDSAVLLATLAERDQRVQPFYVRSGLVWETAELSAIGRFLDCLATPKVLPLVTLRLPVGDLYADHWSLTGDAVPNAESSDEAVYLPGRNALLLIKVALWCQLHGIGELALGALSSNPFPDADPEFFRSLERTVAQAMGTSIAFTRPFAELDKRSVMRIGRDLPLQHTFSCIAPKAGIHCGECNKCAERRWGFIHAGIPDPTEYVSGTAPAGSLESPSDEFRS